MTDALVEPPVIDPAANPAVVDPSLDSRAITFENLAGARGAGGTAHGGRKGAPNRLLQPGERVVLADIEGPGIIRHIWMTFPPARPERMRAALPRGVLRRRNRAEHLRAVPRLLRVAARATGRVRVGADGRARRPRLQHLRADAVRPEGARRSRQRQSAAHDALLPDRLHAASGAAGRARLSCTCRSGARTRPSCAATS